MDHKEERPVTLRNWYVKQAEDGSLLAKGNVTGHNRLPDSLHIHTSPVQDITVDFEKEEALIKTENTLYHCPLAYCRFGRQDDHPDLVPDYEKIKEKFGEARQNPVIEEDKVLLVLSNFDEYYFHRLYCKKTGAEDEVNYTAFPHIGTVQDSYLIEAVQDDISLRYFPHMGNIEFYVMATGEMPLYIENIGDITLYVKTRYGLIRFDAGERKKVCAENATEEIPLPGGDLYSAREEEDTPEGGGE